MDRNSDRLSAACRRHGAGADQQRRLSQSPVRMIVPFGAGGPGDIFARLIGQKLSEQLGQQFVIENRPGAGGNIGAGVAARAPADGYTLLVGSSTLWVSRDRGRQRQRPMLVRSGLKADNWQNISAGPLSAMSRHMQCSK